MWRRLEDAAELHAFFGRNDPLCAMALDRHRLTASAEAYVDTTEAVTTTAVMRIGDEGFCFGESEALMEKAPAILADCERIEGFPSQSVGEIARRVGTPILGGDYDCVELLTAVKMDGVRVRTATTREDCEAAARIYDEAQGESATGESMRKIVASQRGAECLLLAELDGQTCGMMRVCSDTGRFACLCGLSVLPYYRRRHVGTALASAAITRCQQAERRPIAFVGQWNEAAVRMWSRFQQRTITEQYAIYWMR